jgi:DNA-binding transcriptional LysR family regulator
MNLSIRQINYVCEVARLGSIGGASKRLRISQSSILAAIDLAEVTLNAQIFNRQQARGVTVTPAGERFLRAARGLLAAEQEFDQIIDTLVEGMPRHIKVGCFEPFGALFMPAVMKRFVEKTGPCEVSLYEGDHAQLREWLASGLVEVVVTYDIGAGFGEDYTPICKVPAHALINREDSLAQQKSVSISELATRPLVLLDMPETRTYLITLFDLVAERPQVSFRTRSYDSVRAAVSSGFGVSVLNMKPFEASSKDPENLIRLPISDALPHPTLIVADTYGKRRPKYISYLIEVIDDYFHQLEPDLYSFMAPNPRDRL